MTAVLTDPNALQAGDDPREHEAISEETRPPYVSVSVDIGGKTWTIGAVLHSPQVTDADIAEALVESAFAVAGLGGRSRYVAMQRAIALHATEPAVPALPAPAEQALDAPEPFEQPALVPAEEPAELDVDQADVDTEPAELTADVEAERPKSARTQRRVRRDLGKDNTGDDE